MKSKKIIRVQQINPVDYFNQTQVQYMFEYMLEKNNIKKTSINSFTYVENKSDETKKMIVIENNCFVAKEKNGLHMEVNKPYTPFMMLQKYRFKDRFNQALYFVIYKIMNNDINYIRVGTKYFKKTEKIDHNGINRRELKVWEKQTITDDYGKFILDEIPKFDDFTLEPNNKNYQSIIKNNYNLYTEFQHEPCQDKDYKGEEQFYWIQTLLEHIFGEQYELGIKYMKVLYDKPKQKLPILVLTSEERSTGKTTFVDLLEMIFGDNTVIINPQDISSSFNSSYSNKNIIMIEESRFESVQATEKIKNLATQKKMLVNTKFVQQYSIPFYGHLVITSNDENKFSKVDNPEIRYWVRKIPSLKGIANHNILNDMKKEIKYFLYYLNTLKDVDTSKSRMVFTAEEIKTEALSRVKKESLPNLHKEIMIYLDDYGANNTSVIEFEFTAKDIKQKFFLNNHKIDMNYINKILRDSMKLERRKMKRYIPLISSVRLAESRVSGRPYVYKNKYYEQ